MIIWLRQHASEPLARGERIGVGMEGEVVRREALAQLVELDEGYLALQQQHREVLAAAHEEAAALVAKSAEDAQVLREAAQREFDSAHERGYEAGQRDALADWYGRTAQMLVQRQEIQRSLSARVAQLVVAAVQKIVTGESPAALFVRAAQEVERIVDGGSYLRVRVHPDNRDMAALEFERVAAHWRELDRPVSLTVSADGTLAPGACLCETDIGSIDASLEVQLDAVRMAVERALERASDENDDALPLTVDFGEADLAGDRTDAAEDTADPIVDPIAACDDALSALPDEDGGLDGIGDADEAWRIALDWPVEKAGDSGGDGAPDDDIFATRTVTL
jgi:type III secretion protein L